MNFLRAFFVFGLISSTYFAHAEQNLTTEQLKQAYIIDNLIIYMHSGPGKQYRIIGTMEAGEAVQLTGEQANDFVQIQLEKDKTAWIEQANVQNKAGLKFVVAELNSQLAEQQSQLAQNEQALMASQQQVTELSSKKQQQQKHTTELEQQLAELKKQLKDQDFELKKRWFFTGAIVLGAGLLLGLILPRLITRRKSSMESWR